MKRWGHLADSIAVNETMRNGEDEDLPDLHDEEDEGIHLTPNGIVPQLFVWKMLENKPVQKN